MSRKEKTYHFIYKTIDTRNGNFYIGMRSTDNLNDGYVGSGTRLRKLIYKYGKEIFKIEILEFYPERKLLFEREKEIVNSDLLKEKKCMNLVIGGKGFIDDERHETISKYANKKLHEKRKLDKDFDIFWRNRLSETTTRGIKEGKIKTWKDNYSWKDKKHSEDTKTKIGLISSVNQKGEKNSQFGTCWITNGNENKKIKKNEEIPNEWKLGRVKNCLMV